MSNSKTLKNILSLCTTLNPPTNLIDGLEEVLPYPYKHEEIMNDHVPEFYSEQRMENDILAKCLNDGPEREYYDIYRYANGLPAMVCRFQSSDWGVSVWRKADYTIVVCMVKIVQNKLEYYDKDYFKLRRFKS